jgi:hypothetical protein
LVFIETPFKVVFFYTKFPLKFRLKIGEKIGDYNFPVSGKKEKKVFKKKSFHLIVFGGLF